MFGFLKKKLKKSVENITENIEEQGEEEIKEVPLEKEEEKKGFFSKLKQRFSKREEDIKSETEEKKPETEDKKAEEKEEQKEEIEKKEPEQKQTHETEDKKEKKPEKEEHKEEIEKKEPEQKQTHETEDKKAEEKEEQKPKKEKILEEIKETYDKDKSEKIIRESTGMDIKGEPVEKKLIKQDQEKHKQEKKVEKDIKHVKEDIKKVEEDIEEHKSPKDIKKDINKAQKDINNTIKEEKKLIKPTAEEILEEVKEEQDEIKKDAADIEKDITKAKKHIDSKDIKKLKKDINKIEKDTKKFIKEHGKDLQKEKKLEEKADIHELDAKAVQKEAKGFFSRLKQKIVTKKISAEQFENIFWELELILLENNVAVEVIDKIKKELKSALVEKPIKRGMISSTITNTLKETIEKLFDVEQINILEKIKNKKPYVICFVGVNGSGKTTTIAKVAQFLKNNNLSCVMAAADTFRAAAIDQLEEHANNLNIKMIKHDYGSDAAAVAFDAVKYAEAKEIDCVLIDTAGRLHSNINLMQELKKVTRVADPDLKIFVGEAITGNDCIEQAQKFNESVGIDGIVLAKADVDEKGGASISVSYVTKKPILFFGTGQNYEDLEKFDKNIIMENLGL